VIESGETFRGGRHVQSRDVYRKTEALEKAVGFGLMIFLPTRKPDELSGQHLSLTGRTARSCTSSAWPRPGWPPSSTPMKARRPSSRRYRDRGHHLGRRTAEDQGPGPRGRRPPDQAAGGLRRRSCARPWPPAGPSHYLPPYRHDKKIVLSGLLGIPVGELKAKASAAFIKAAVDQRILKTKEEIREIETPSPSAAKCTWPP